MTDKLRVYSPAAVKVTYGGVASIKGFADGTAIEIQRNTPNTTVIAGMQGEQGITKVSDNSGTITFTLKQTARTNEILSAVQTAQDADDSLLFRENLTISDPSGGVLVLAKDCHIQEPASMALGDSENNRVWTFFVEDLQYLNLPNGVTQTAAGAARVNDAIEALRTATELSESGI